MKTLQIDFAPPSLARTLHRTGTAAWIIAAAALLLCFAAAVLGARLVAQQRADQARLNAAMTRAKAPVTVAVSVPVTPISEPQAAAVNSAVMQLNLPWRALHDAIGAATPPSIAMLALEPDARRRSVKITAEAKTSDAMIAYVEALKEQEFFTAVALSRHEINELDPNKPIRFQLDAEWSAP
jgi:Tfp pilus assembly protein PilN